MQNPMLDQLLDFPVIAAAKNEEGLEHALASPSPVIFLLFGDLCRVGATVRRIKGAGKLAVVHIDLIDGLANHEVSVRFLKDNTAADGIISTKPQLIRFGKELGFITVERFFLLDSMSLQNAEKHLSATAADFTEILPGVMPKIIRRFVRRSQIPVIAGGMVLDKEDVVTALGAGATAVSTTKEELWLA